MTRKSLKKAFPDKKDLIDSNFNEKTAPDPEVAVIGLLANSEDSRVGLQKYPSGITITPCQADILISGN
ncbi:MAG: hypothetical protein MZV63_22360 [Marinilabiliales bacterium]|nr:hypothetical protein [Marinilabiliales bacterium]